mgnify:CR=1 FL=1
MSQNKAKLFGIFMTIAVVADPVKYNAKIAELEQHFAPYIEVIKPLIELTPDDVIDTLRARFPEIDKELSSPLAPKVVSRIQEYLKKKGANDGNLP